jgi:hypothetical protein
MQPTCLHRAIAYWPKMGESFCPLARRKMAGLAPEPGHLFIGDDQASATYRG